MRSFVKGRAANQRKICPKGSSCPYKDEYQHRLEFNHVSSSSSQKNTENSQTTTTVTPFSGSGTVLGGGNIKATKAATRTDLVRNVRTTFLDRVEESAKMNVGIKRKHQDAKDTNENTLAATDQRMIFCKYCSTFFPSRLEDQHKSCKQPVEKTKNFIPLAPPSFDPTSSDLNKIEESRRLQRQQDQEYEESLLLEALEKSAGEERERQQAQIQHQNEEAAELKRAELESRVSSRLERKQQAKIHLLAEPDPHSYHQDIVTIRFTLPSNSRIIRKFRVDHSIQDAFQFLASLDDLKDIDSLQLRTMDNKCVIDINDDDTFRVHGLIANCSLVVVVCDDNENEDSTTIEEHVVTTKPTICVDKSEFESILLSEQSVNNRDIITIIDLT